MENEKNITMEEILRHVYSSQKKKKKAQSSFSIPHKQPTNNSVDSVVTFYCWQFTQSLSLCHVLKYCHTFAFAMKPEITIK